MNPNTVFRPYRRRPTREVSVGHVIVGGNYPIRVQSMTTPATTDIRGTVDQILRLVDAGCEIVRVTVPTSRDALSLPGIREGLAAARVSVPLVADIHFTPAAAMKAVEHVEKIRINPGNYADKKKFAVREYTDAQYCEELERIGDVFRPLVRRCRELGVAMRIGTNHGSLSDRIMNRYGDTPEGMVESALEFVRICEADGYREIILSMKASNPLVVLQTYRLLVDRMAAEQMHYPLHLGVTEAGDGEDARIKSAIGIGALLDEGLGDTVRVSLTEDPVAEIPVARALVAPYNELDDSIGKSAPGPTRLYRRRPSRSVTVGPRTIGNGAPVLVEIPLATPVTSAASVRTALDAEAGVRVPEDTRAELVSVTVGDPREIEAVRRLRESMELVAPAVALSMRVEPAAVAWTSNDLSRACAAAHRLHLRLPAADVERLTGLFPELAAHGTALLVEGSGAPGDGASAVEAAHRGARAAAAAGFEPLLLALDPVACGSPLYWMPRLATRLDEDGLDLPLVLVDRPVPRGVDGLLGPSTALGGLLCEGLGDAVHVETEPDTESRRLVYGILQAARVRITRTEFISCPSCGRTLFDLEETTARIKARTSHLKGVKIAVMGCIVNGPGEMADADFGYVGWGEDKIALFVGKELVEKDIPTGEADERLIRLIKEHGRWVEPATVGAG